MKKQNNAFKLTFLGAAVAALGVGCASSGYARYDADADTSNDMGASAQVELGTDNDVIAANADDQAAAQSTVSALSRTFDTRANWVNKFPFYDWDIRTIETYTFAAPDPQLNVSGSSDAPSFSASLPPGSVFVEAAGGSGEVRAGRVIRHSPNPTR